MGYLEWGTQLVIVRYFENYKDDLIITTRNSIREWRNGDSWNLKISE